MFVKALGVDSNKGKGTSMRSCGVPKTIKMDGCLRTKIETKGTNSVESGVPKPIYTDGRLRPTKSDDSNAFGIKLDKNHNLVSKSNSCSGQEMATDAIGDSADTSTLVETVAGEKPSLDFERKVRVQPGGKVTGKVKDGKGYPWT